MSLSLNADKQNQDGHHRKIDFIDILLYAAIVTGVIVSILAIARVINLSSYVDKQQQILAQTQSKIAIVKTSITDNQSMIDYLVSQIRILCPERTLPAATRMTETQRTLLLNRSQLTNPYCAATTWRPTAAFLQIYNRALVARIDGRNDDAAALFADALRIPDIEQVDPQWRARAYEGEAYALMNLGRLDAAAKSDEKSLALYRDLVFAGLTRIKIMCRQQVPAAQIQNALTGLRQQMAGLASSAQAKLNRATQDAEREVARNSLIYANLDRGYIESDGELFTTCAYAGIKAQKN